MHLLNASIDADRHVTELSLVTHSVRVPDEVAPAAPLADPHRIYPAVNGHLGRTDEGTELLIRELVSEVCASLQEGARDGVTSGRHGYERDLLDGSGSGAILLSPSAARPVVLDEGHHSRSDVGIFLFLPVVVCVICVRL